MMLPEEYVLYKDKMVLHVRFKSSAMMQKYLKVSTERLSQFIPCILFL